MIQPVGSALASLRDDIGERDMPELAISRDARRLTGDEVKRFHDVGYVKNLPLLDDASVKKLQADFISLIDMVPDDVDIYRVNNWHKANRWFHDLAHTSAILDYVQDLLGGDFVHWGGAFFIKFPHDESTVPWHQDAKYWPLEPRTTVTVWLAVFDSDRENGCMRVIPGSHRWGDLTHEEISDSPDWHDRSEVKAKGKGKYVLWQRVDPKQFSEDDAADIDLSAGEISLHDDDLIHGSTGNPSDRMRAGITLRYSPPNVKCDLSVWPNFEVYPARGVDRYHHNPIGKVPTENAYPTSFNQNSDEFE